MLCVFLGSTIELREGCSPTLLLLGKTLSFITSRLACNAIPLLLAIFDCCQNTCWKIFLQTKYSNETVEFIKIANYLLLFQTSKSKTVPDENAKCGFELKTLEIFTVVFDWKPIFFPVSRKIKWYKTKYLFIFGCWLVNLAGQQQNSKKNNTHTFFKS